MNNEETIRITIMAGILAIFFGIKQTITEETFEIINVKLSLKFVSNIFFDFLLWMYIVYFLVLALNYGFNNRIKIKYEGFIFDFITTSTIVLIFITLSLLGIIKSVVAFPEYIQAGWKTNFLILASAVLATIFFLRNMSNYFKKLTGLINPDNKMKESRGSLGFWGWVVIVSSVILLIFFLFNGKYSFALSFGLTMVLFIILIRVLRINLREEDYKIAEKKIELNKLRLSKYETLSVSLISIGVGVFSAGYGSGNLFENVNTWIGMGMIIVGILIERFHVETRYKILEEYYEKNEKEKIKR
ncbi:MAG: hypothetical protein AABX23_04780 [Nanoarchaeota archaeon]